MQLINFIHQIATTLGDFFDLENGFLRYEMESFKQGPKIRGAGQRPKQKPQLCNEWQIETAMLSMCGGGSTRVCSMLDTHPTHVSPPRVSPLYRKLDC